MKMHTVRASSVILLLAFASAFLSGCANHISVASKYIKTEIPDKAKVLKCIDDEDWFWCVIQFDDKDSDAFKSTVLSSLAWHPMPLAPELQEAEDFLQPKTSEFAGHIPTKNKHGFYYFRDIEAEYLDGRSNPAKQKNSSIPFFKKGGMNYVFGYFDDRENKLYLWWCHT